MLLVGCFNVALMLTWRDHSVKILAEDFGKTKYRKTIS